MEQETIKIDEQNFKILTPMPPKEENCNLDIFFAEIEQHKAIIANAENGIAECEAKIAKGRDLGVKTQVEVQEIQQEIQKQALEEIKEEEIIEPTDEEFEEETIDEEVVEPIKEEKEVVELLEEIKVEK